VQLGHTFVRTTELYAEFYRPEVVGRGTPMGEVVLSARQKVSSECANNVRNSKVKAKRSTRRKGGYAGIS